ncbi:unnamed protein product [Phaedon cochleariae]|uniref:Cellulase n=1 Tax=Phaedon cochleariae TaxID=80249 RepID=A0A9P0GPK8_PHACE|nr:unnamed protein product [Phaedon cochleariae]
MQVIVLPLVFLAIFAASGSLAAADASHEIVPVNGGLSGYGTTTRYWDCCKPSCAWKENIKTPTMTPVQTCAIDGNTVVDASVQSGCIGGSSYMCSNQQAFVVNSTLAFGFAAGSFTGGVDNNLCCSCMLLTFQGQLAGKQFLVQITNTGGDLGSNQFDLAIPGGGVGNFTQGCHDQWNAPWIGWGDQYGGVYSAEQCSELPEVLQPGCRFRFEFLENVSNPQVSFQQVQCPAEIVAISNCAL